MKNNKKKLRKRCLFLGFSIIVLVCIIYNREHYSEMLKVKELIFSTKINNWFTVGSPGIHIDEEQKQFELIYKLKRVTNAEFANKASDIRREVENFLVKNKDYFLNDNYEIKLTFRTINQSEFVVFTNVNRYDEICFTNNKLRCVYVYVQSPIDQLVNYYDMELMLLDRIDGNLEILKIFDDLQYISSFNRIFTEEVKKIKEIQPNCEIIDYSSNFFSRWNIK